MKDLVWELFLMLREVMPATEANTKRQHEWAARFHELEMAPADIQQANVEPANAVEDDEPEPDEHPMAHAARSKLGTRKKR
jgi:hypothetical protein